MKALYTLIPLLILSGILAGTVWAESPAPEEPALQGLPQIKVVADINAGPAKLLATRLRLAYDTYDQLVETGRPVQMVLTFRGKASRLIARTDDVYADDAKADKEKIDNWIAQFHEMGLRMEQCGIAARANGLKPTDFPKGVILVKNGYVSLIGYQNQGYALLPME